MTRRRRRAIKKENAKGSNVSVKDTKAISSMHQKQIASKGQMLASQGANEKSTVSASQVVRQTISDNIKSTSISNVASLFQKKKHLLVPVNVQAFVVPAEQRTTPDVKQHREVEKQHLGKIASLEYAVSSALRSRKIIIQSMDEIQKEASKQPQSDKSGDKKSEKKDANDKAKSRGNKSEKRAKQMYQKLDGLKAELVMQDKEIQRLESELKAAKLDLDSLKDMASFLSTNESKSPSRKHASLKTTYSQQEGESKVWGLPPPFSYESVSNGGGLDPGIHLMWTLPQALLQGAASEDDSFIEEDTYLDLDDVVPDGLIPADGALRRITLREAIDERIEFTRANEGQQTLSESLTFPQLPDRWLVVRQKKADKSSVLDSAWIVNSDTLKVQNLTDYVSSAASTKSSSLTGIGPHDGDFYWTATYDNVEGRFSFHDVPSSNGNYDYFVCGWYTNQQNDPAFMPSSASEHEWFDRIENEFNWAINRSNIDNDPTIELSKEILDFMMKYAAAKEVKR